MSLKKNIIRIFSANFITMLSSIVIGFIVPAVLSIESYSYVKTYTFYISYITFFSLGFVDGMYIKYGGKDRNIIDMSQVKMEHRVYIALQIFIMILFLFIGVINKDIIILFMALTIIPVNVSGFYKMFYQATGQFKEYSKVTYIYNIVYLLLNVFLAIIFKSDNYILYCLTSLVANAVVFIILEIKFNKDTRGIKSKYNSNVWKNIKIGFFILIGNLSVMLFYAIDRWFIKIFFNVDTFAYYSFAISILNVVNVLISAISVTFYNYLAKGENKDKVIELKKYFLIIGIFASGGYFIFAAIVSLMLKKYIPSLSIISISFANYPYMIVINALYVNLYKVRKDEHKYVKVVFKMLLVSVLYNIIALTIFKRAEAITVATMISFITWYIYSVKDFDYLKPSVKEITYLCILNISFLILSNYLNWILGGLIYYILVIIITYIFYNDLISSNVLCLYQKLLKR